MSLEGKYLRDLGLLLRDEVIRARQGLSLARNDRERQFEIGRLTAYCEALSLMRQQAIACGIPLDQLSLADFDPEDILLTVPATNHSAAADAS